MVACWHCGSTNSSEMSMGTWVRKAGGQVTTGNVCKDCNDRAAPYTWPDGMEVCPACKRGFREAVRIVARDNHSRLVVEFLCDACMAKQGFRI